MDELSSRSTVEKSLHTASVVEAIAVDAILAAAQSLICLLILTGSLLTDITPKLTPIDGRFPFDDLYKGKYTCLLNKHASDSEEDEEEEGENEANDQDDEEGDEDLSGEGEEEDDPEDDPEADPEANGAGGSDGEDDEEDDGDEDNEEDEEEEEEDENEDEEEVPQPPAKKRK